MHRNVDFLGNCDFGKLANRGPKKTFCEKWPTIRIRLQHTGANCESESRKCFPRCPELRGLASPIFGRPGRPKRSFSEKGRKCAENSAILVHLEDFSKNAMIGPASDQKTSFRTRRRSGAEKRISTIPIHNSPPCARNGSEL